MTIYDATQTVKEFNPSSIRFDQMLDWINQLEGLITEDIEKIYNADAVFVPYDWRSMGTEKQQETNLIVPFPYDEIYPAYLRMKIDEATGENLRYNNSSVQFNTLLDNYTKHCARTRKASFYPKFKF